MSKDLIFGFTKKDWSRKPPEIVHECGPESCMITYRKEPLTADEKSKLDSLAQLKMKAESGDRQSQKQWKKLSIKVVSLKEKAKKGDPKAKHTVDILEDSGLFGHVQNISGSMEPRDQDMIDKLIQRAGEDSGWPVYISTSQHSDYRNRAAKGDHRAAEVLSIIDRNVKAGRLKISDEKKTDFSRYPIGNDDEDQGRKVLEALARKGDIKSLLKLKKIRQEEALEVHGADPDECEAARYGGASESRALTRTRGIVISDEEIKANMQGSVALVEGQGSYPRHRRRHRHLRNQGQQPGQYPNQGQVPGQPYQGATTYVASRDAQKSQIVRSLYSQIKREHINWMTNQDLQNGITNQTADRYQQAARAWARDQLQQQQLPTRYTASGTNQWQQPVSWFQAQAQAVLNSSAGQRATQINASSATAAVPYSPSYPYTAAPPPAPTASSPANVYYPSSSSPSSYVAPGTSSSDDPSLYDDDQQGWPSPLLMHGDFVGDEARAEGEDGMSCGLDLPHNEYRALIMDQASKSAGNRKPGTKHLFLAKNKVDQALGSSGVSIFIPGSGPARRTV